MTLGSSAATFYRVRGSSYEFFIFVWRRYIVTAVDKLLLQTVKPCQRRLHTDLGTPCATDIKILKAWFKNGKLHVLYRRRVAIHSVM